MVQGELKGGRNCVLHQKVIELLCMHGTHFLLIPAHGQRQLWNVYKSLPLYDLNSIDLCMACSVFCSKELRVSVIAVLFLPPSNSPWTGANSDQLANSNHVSPGRLAAFTNQESFYRINHARGNNHIIHVKPFLETVI